MRWLFCGVVLFLLVLPAHAQDETFTLAGQLTQGTPNGSPLRENLPLLLKILDENGQEIGVKQTLAQNDFRFQFENLPANPQHFYVVTATWAGLEQTTPPLTLALLPASLDFPLYETTADLGDVVAYRGNVRLEFEEVNRLGLQVLVELSYTNLGDRIVWNEALRHSLVMELPVGAFGFAAEVPSANAAQRYQFIDEVANLAIPAVKDTLPLLPNFPNVMRISFFVPYDDGAVIDMRLPLALDDFRLFMRAEQVQLTSADLQLTEETETSSGRVYQVYEQIVPFERNQPIQFTLLGTSINSQPPLPPVNERGSNAVIFVGIVVAMIFSGVILWLIHRTNSA